MMRSTQRANIERTIFGEEAKYLGALRFTLCGLLRGGLAQGLGDLAQEEGPHGKSKEKQTASTNLGD